jgi:hypothetical protein
MAAWKRQVRSLRAARSIPGLRQTVASCGRGFCGTRERVPFRIGGSGWRREGCGLIPLVQKRDVGHPISNVRELKAVARRLVRGSEAWSVRAVEMGRAFSPWVCVEPGTWASAQADMLARLWRLSRWWRERFTSHPSRAWMGHPSRVAVRAGYIPPKRSLDGAPELWGWVESVPTIGAMKPRRSWGTRFYRLDEGQLQRF